MFRLNHRSIKVTLFSEIHIKIISKISLTYHQIAPLLCIYNFIITFPARQTICALYWSFTFLENPYYNKLNSSLIFPSLMHNLTYLDIKILSFKKSR